MPPRSINRRNAPQSPPKPVTQLAKSTRRSARGQSQDPTNDTVIVESPTRGNKRGKQPDKSALADIAESATGQLTTFEQDGAPVEGTTITEFHQTDSRFHRPEMIAALADLQDDANAFISLATAADEDDVAILHSQNDEGLPPSARRFKGRFKGLLDTFQSSLEPYKDATEPFIDVVTAVTTLADVSSWGEVTEQDRGSEALFQLANVTELLNMTLHGRAASSIDWINTNFPKPFFTGFLASWGSPLAEKTVALALGIRTQYFMNLLYQRMDQPDFDPDYLLQSVFLNNEGKPLALGLTDGGEEDNMQESCQPMFGQRAQEIRQHFSLEEPYVNTETLETSFSWPAFRAELVQWAVIRANGLNMQISNRGGAKALQIYLQGGVPVAPASDKKRKSGADKSRQVSEMLAVLQANKARRETLNAQTEKLLGSARVEEIQESPIQTGAYEPATNDVGYDDGNVLSSQQSQQVLETLRLHAAQSNKENLQAGRKGKSANRQAGAQNTEPFDDSSFVNGEAGPSRKRDREIELDDDAGSIQFEEDTRPQANKRARSNAAPDELGEAAEQLAVNAQLLSHAASQPLPNRPALTPRQPHSQLPASTAPELGQAQSPIRSSQVVAGTQAKGPQVRVPFTPEENIRLVELITSLPEGTMRISWAQLEKEDLRHPEGALLQKRGQVGLKDKARNLKMDFLKAREPPPRNFNLIPLGNRLIDQLDKLGVPHTER